MPGKKKKFIDKKNSVTFHLVHRSQKDPLQADDDAPQRVLLPADTARTSTQKEEERKYGVFFDDDYDYMQHLRDADELNKVEPIQSFRVTHPKPVQQIPLKDTNPGISLPSTVFGSTVETDVGLLNKAAPVSGPRLDWDPDIVAAMDVDFDFNDPDNQLDDDFIVMANQEGVEEHTEEFNSDEGLVSEDDDGDVYRPVKPVGIRPQKEVRNDDDVLSDEAEYSDQEGSDVGSLGDMSYNDTKSRFTEYSMTSSVTTRNEGLTLLDDRFEKFYEQYDDDDIGALDHEDIGGRITSDNPLVAQALEEFETQQQLQKLKEEVEKGEKIVEDDDSEDDSDDDDDDDLVKMVIPAAKEKWDCESILSTRSTLYNHPTLIKEPRKEKVKQPIELTKRAGIPADVLPTRGLTQKQLEELDHEQSIDPATTHRPKGETSEERKHRKLAVKDERKARREQKKSNKMAFKAESIRQHKEVLNLKQNITGIPLT